MSMPTTTWPGRLTPVRSPSVSNAIALTSTASVSPVRSRAATIRAGRSPASTTRWSVSRVAAVWKYMPMPARNAADHAAVASSTAAPPRPPRIRAASANVPATTTTNTTGTTTSSSRLTGLRA
ncbi:hypothetical protein [Micromonospora kangleipakensis]|uniref:hypothetical protein n=1 Tax=Micromonospora kangleipakensis TaxID=1077942 RepID=UPI001A9150E9|nr:hypothetical protein [Micromonospora kangleipakensis]